MQNQNPKEEGVRLNRFLAESGLGSRRDADTLIEQNQVTVNGQVVDSPALRIDAEKDAVKVSGRRIFPQRQTYILMNKPEGVISTVDDPEHRPTVVSLLKGVKARVYPVGRLDFNTSGVILLTNDGELALRLTHPRYGFEKTYQALVSRIPTPAAIQKMARGIMIPSWSGRYEKTLPSKVRMVAQNRKGAILEIVLREGRQHQVKKMCMAVHHPVLKLVRIKFGFLTTTGLAPGQWRYLTPQEIERLQAFEGEARSSQSAHPVDRKAAEIRPRKNQSRVHRARQPRSQRSSA